MVQHDRGAASQSCPPFPLSRSNFAIQHRFACCDCAGALGVVGAHAVSTELTLLLRYAYDRGGDAAAGPLAFLQYNTIQYNTIQYLKLLF